MSGFQTILEIHQSISINNRRVIGQQISRSGQMTVAEYLTSVPWVFTVKPHNYLYYPEVRDIIQSIDNYDRQLVDYLSFDTPNLEWFVKMQGTATAATLAATPSTNSQVLNVTSNGTFKAGDFIQIGLYVYKVTADSTGSIVYINRPVIGTPQSGDTITLGKDVAFRVVAESCPTYTLTPMTDGAFVAWDGDFVFREYITG